MASSDGHVHEDEVSLSNFCRKMDILRNEGYRHDVIIQGQDNEEIFAHAIVLAARFAHLKDILPDPQLNSIARIVWPQFPTSVIKCIVSYAYTGSLHLNIGNALQVFLIANNLRATALRKSCLDYICPRLTIETMEKTWKIAEQTSSEDLKDACLNCMNVNFASIISTPLLHTIQFPSFLSLLQRPQDDSGTDEENKFLLIGAWIEADTENRVDHISDLLSTIAANRLTQDFIIDQLTCDSAFANCLAAKKWMGSALKRTRLQPLLVAR